MKTTLQRLIKNEWGWDAVGLLLVVIASYAVILSYIISFALSY